MTPKNQWRFSLVTAAIVCAASSTPALAEENAVVAAYRLRMDGSVDDAKKVLKQHLQKHPEHAPAWLELARLEFHRGGSTGELDLAQQAIERAISSSPDTAVYYRWAARVAIYYGILKAKDRPMMIEEFKKAATAAEKAVTLDPADHEARRMLVSLYGNNPPALGGNKQRAEQHVKALEARSPVDGAAGRCELSHEQQPEKKLALWRELAKEFENDPRVHEHLALQLAWDGDVQQATLHADKALSFSQQRSHILMHLARACALQEKFEPAEQFARRYLATDPPGPLAFRAWTRMALGRIQAKTGDNEAAAESLAKARMLDPYCWFTMSPPPEQLFQTP